MRLSVKSRREFLETSAGLSAGLLLSTPLRAASGRVLAAPMRLDGKRLVVPCTVQDHGPFQFAIDTGGVVSLIRRDVADQLHLQLKGFTQLDVAGTDGRYPLFDAADVRFGNSFRQRHVVFAGVDHVGFGGDVMGSLAAGCLTAADSELDFSAKEWRLYPDGGPGHDGWAAHERAIISDGPVGGSSYLFADAQLGSQRLRCLLDTGAPSWLRLSGGAARDSGLLHAQKWSPAGGRGRDVFRIVRSREPLEFAGVSVQRPLVLLQPSRSSRLSEALIGLPVIQQTNIATDVRNRRLWTQPNGLPPPPQRYNMSGLWINRRDSGIVADVIGGGSPAEQAGIRPGDRIYEAEFQPLIDRLNGNAGDQVSLVVGGPEARREVRLTLADYL